MEQIYTEEICMLRIKVGSDHFKCLRADCGSYERRWSVENLLLLRVAFIGWLGKGRILSQLEKIFCLPSTIPLSERFLNYWWIIGSNRQKQ